MTEYRIVATIDTLHTDTGEKFHQEAAAPVYGGRPHTRVTRDKARAEQYLEEAIKNCRAFDEMTQNRTLRGNIKYWQSNIRIQSREVSDWTDE